MKIVFLLTAILFFNEAIFSQWPGNENPLAVKELKLTRYQQKKIKRINSKAASQITLLQGKQGNDVKVMARIDKIKSTRIKEIRSCLTPEQRLIWRKKLIENKPRRGVTGLPNERKRG